VLEFNPDGSGRRVYASVIRNAVASRSSADRQIGYLWTSATRSATTRADYISHIEEGGFYGWPWFYIGGHQDPRHAEQASRLNPGEGPGSIAPAALAIDRDALLHGTQFAPEHRGSIFAAEHGSVNKSQRTGYKVFRVPLENGAPTGEYEDFLTGLSSRTRVTSGARPSLAMAPDARCW